MQLIVPFAAPLAEAGRAALRTAALPQLAARLARAREAGRDDGDEWSFTPPHERALARALGFAGGDGLLPWAAWQAAADGITVADLAWGLLTPVHWHLGTDQVSLLDPAALMLDEAGSRTLFDAVHELFTSEGFAMAYGAASRWYVAHESLATLRTASLDRAIGRNVDRWLHDERRDDRGVRLMRRLQNEVQMLLHGHALNAEREARGLLPVNSFWLSGCGVAQPARGTLPQVDERLRAPALAEDWAGYVKAWESLDAEVLTALPAEATLTLCGERSAVTLQAGRGAWARWLALLQRPQPAAWLEAL